MLFFAWFRNAVRNAFLSGVQDALDRLDDLAAAQPQDEPRLQLSLQIEAKHPKLKGVKP